MAEKVAWAVGFCSVVHLCLIAPLFAHPGAINLYVENDGALTPLPGFDPGGFVLFPGIELSSQTPSISVSFPANGVIPGARIDLQIMQSLTFWDGSGIRTTPHSIRIEAPTVDIEGGIVTGEKQVYVISQNTRVQRGMTWGTYSGNNFWDSNGLYFLDSITAPPGIYGLVFRVTSPRHFASLPFLVPMVYDPANLWNLAEEDAGIDLLRQLVRSQTGDFDRDSDFDCADLNLLSAAMVAGSSDLRFDLNSDGMVSTLDATAWFADAGSAHLASGQSYLLGDANLDGVVDGTDFGIWNAHKFSSSNAYCDGDFNFDGLVDGSDFGIWNAAKFTSADGVTSVLTPEPGMASLAAWAWLVMAVSGRSNAVRRRPCRSGMNPAIAPIK